MASPAALRFGVAVARIRLLRDTAHDVRLRPIERNRAQVLLHASLAGYVAAWEAYLEQLVRDVFDVTARPLQTQYHAVHSLLKEHSKAEINVFNTPNAENARNLLLRYTGFDPWPFWVWPARHMNAVQIRDRLVEILKVRHSFAHGFSMPAYSWNTSSSGHVRLNWAAIAMTDYFFQNLVRRTDSGMRGHILATYGQAAF